MNTKNFFIKIVSGLGLRLGLGLGLAAIIALNALALPEILLFAADCAAPSALPEISASGGIAIDMLTPKISVLPRGMTYTVFPPNTKNVKRISGVKFYLVSELTAPDDSCGEPRATVYRHYVSEGERLSLSVRTLRTYTDEEELDLYTVKGGASEGTFTVKKSGEANTYEHMEQGR